MRTVGAYEANTNLARLLADVEAGESISIVNQGREIARLVPTGDSPATAADVGAAVRAARDGIRRRGHSVRRLIQTGSTDHHR